MKGLKIVTLLVVLSFLVVSCSKPEDEYLSKVYPKDSRTWAIQELIKMAKKGQIVNKEKVAKKLLSLDKTPDVGAGILAVGELKYAPAIPRLKEIAETCFQTQSTRNLKTLEAIATTLGKIGDPAAVPILEKYFTINTPDGLAQGQREKPESVAKRSAIEALSKMPAESKHLVPQIIQVLESKKEDFGTKYTVAGILGEFGDAQAVKPLVTSLFYEEMGFSLFPEARKSLIRLGKYAETELVKAYEMQNPGVNKLMDANKEKALKQFCPEYIDAEKKKKGECEKHDEYMGAIASIDAATKIKTSMILSDIRSQKVVDVLIAELQNQLSREDKQPYLAEHLSVQLAHMGDFKATDVLLKMVSKDFALKEAKKKGGKKDKGAGGMDPKDAAKEAKVALRGQEVSIRMKGAEALGILGDRKAIPYLVKVIKSPIDKEMNMQNETIYFYEPQVWAADAYTRMIDDAAGADEFISIAKKFIEDGKKYTDKVETKAKDKVNKEMSGREIKPEDLKKKVDSEARLDVNYDSTKRSVTMMEKFSKRAEVAKQCLADINCYAGKLTDKEPATVEKAVFMIGFAKKMSEFKDKLAPVFFNPEPFVRDALVIAMLKTEDKAYVAILKDVVAKEGDKVEYADSSKEFKALLSYLTSY